MDKGKVTSFKNQRRKNMREQIKERMINKLVFRSDSMKQVLKKNPSILENLKNMKLEKIMELKATFSNMPNSLIETNNQMIYIKKSIPSVLENYKFWRKLVHQWQEHFKEAERANSIEDMEKCYEEIEKCSEQLKVAEQNIRHLALQLEVLCHIYDGANVSIEYFSNVIGINPIHAKINVEDYKEHLREDMSYHYQLLDFGVENSHEHEGWKSNRNGMLFFDLCLENLMILIDSNKEIKEEVDNKMMDMMEEMGVQPYVLTEDKNGNKQLKEYYRPLRVVK